MYSIKSSSQFKRDVKLCKKRGKDIDKFKIIHELLVHDKALPAHNRNHMLSSNWHGFYECHIEPDWLLIYRINSAEHILEYARMGTHSDLF